MKHHRTGNCQEMVFSHSLSLSETNDQRALKGKSLPTLLEMNIKK